MLDLLHKKCKLGGYILVTDRSSVLPFCPNRTEQVNESSVFRAETEQNRTCKKGKKKYLNYGFNKQMNNFELIRCEAWMQQTNKQF